MKRGCSSSFVFREFAPFFLKSLQHCGLSVSSLLQLLVASSFKVLIYKCFIPDMAQVDAGDQGSIQVRSWLSNNRCVASVTHRNHSAFQLDVVIETENASWVEGKYVVLEKDFIQRRCILEVQEDNDNLPSFKVTWHLDGPTTGLLQQRQDS